jgi:hypothetical protein
MTVTMYVLVVPENEGMLAVAHEDPAITVERVGPFARLTGDEAIHIDRRATGCRHAVWYSAVGGLDRSRVAQHDKDALRVIRDA